jgi:L-ascorbate metabolism protein UlaG (beta-lactamase superfamily)
MISSGLKITYVGGPTTSFELGGLRLLTDPTFDPAALSSKLGFRQPTWTASGGSSAVAPVPGTRGRPVESGSNAVDTRGLSEPAAGHNLDSILLPVRPAFR